MIQSAQKRHKGPHKESGRHDITGQESSDPSRLGHGFLDLSPYPLSGHRVNMC